MSWQNLTNEQLEALPTHRLLEVFKRQRTWTLSVQGQHCSCWPFASCYQDELTEEQAETREGRQVRLDFIKALLDSRGHEETKEEVRKPWSKTRVKKDQGRLTRHWSYDPKPSVQRTGPITNPEEAVGLQVFKLSKKPFKSKLVYNTVATVTTNPHTKSVAFSFVEDDSIVDAHICNTRDTK